MRTPVGLLVAALSLSALADTLTFGIVPQQTAVKTVEIWGPIAEHLSQATGLNIEIATAKDIPTFEQNLANQQYDLAYMNPYHYTIFSDSAGYRSIAHRAGKGIRGVVVVRKDSPITALSQLDGQAIAFPAPAAFAATLVTGAEMTQAGISYEPRYTLSHDSVYRAVSSGLMPAGGGVGRTFKATDQATRDSLRILHTTAEYTPHAIAVKSNMSESTAQRLQTVLTSMTNKSLLDPLKIPGFQAASDDAWDDVRALNLEVISP